MSDQSQEPKLTPPAPPQEEETEATQTSKIQFPDVPTETPVAGWATPEAPCVIHSTRFTSDGGWVSITVRGDHPNATLEDFMDLLQYAEQVHGIQATKPDTYPTAPTINPPSAPQNFPATTAETANSAPQAGAAKDDSKGTSALNSVTVEVQPGNKVVVKFSVGKFKWPFQDHRGAEVVAGLFDKELGLTPAMFQKPTFWQPDIPLLVDWEKPDKYYNVVRIHR